MILQVTSLLLALAATPTTAPSARVELVEKFGLNPVTVTLRDGAVTILGAPVEGAAGLYRAPLGAGDPIWGLLARLPKQPKGPAVVPDAPTVHLLLESAAGKRELTAHRAATDPALVAALARLDQLMAAASAKPVAAVSLALIKQDAAPPLIRVTALGTAGAEASFDAGALQVELLTVSPENLGGSWYPHPVHWDPGGTPKAAPVRLRVGEHRDLSLAGKFEPGRAHLMRAVLRGPVVLRAAGQPETTLVTGASSPIIPVGPGKRGP